MSYPKNKLQLKMKQDYIQLVHEGATVSEGLTTASGKHNNPSLNDLSFQLSDQLLGGGCINTAELCQLMGRSKAFTTNIIHLLFVYIRIPVHAPFSLPINNNLKEIFYFRIFFFLNQKKNNCALAPKLFKKKKI